MVSKNNNIEDFKKALKMKDSLEANKATSGSIDPVSTHAFKEFTSYPAFNVEEKLFLNRIAFLVFKRRGSTATFNDIYKILRVLQDGPLEGKVFALFDLMDEDEDGYVNKDDMTKFFKASYLQNLKCENEIDKIVANIFKNGKNYIDKKTAFTIFLSDGKLKELIAGVLQVVSNTESSKTETSEK